MVTRVTLGQDGEAHSQEMPSTKNTVSSDDLDTGGITARTGPAGFATKVHDVADLKDDDLVKLGDMELKVSDARQMGLLDQIVSAAKAQGTPVQPQQQPQSTRSDTGNPEYDAAVDALNAAIEDGSISFEEARSYDAALGEISLAGMTTDQVVQTIADLNSGRMGEHDLSSDKREVINAVTAQVTEAATKSAMDELGEQGFRELDRLAHVHPAVDEIIFKYAVDRATGRNGGVSWADLHADLKEQLGM